MSSTPSFAERLDRALDELLAGSGPGMAAATVGLDAPGRAVLARADLVRQALPVPAVAPRFEARLGARLADVVARRDPLAWAMRHPGRLIVTGAVGSAVGVGVTAFAVWRSSRRSTAARILHR